MVSRPKATTPESDATTGTPFEGLNAGLDFFKDWMNAASSGLPHFMQAATQANAAQTPSWMLPTLDTQELDKRIRDLQAVKFWLEQNAQMVAMTVQTLEVQRMTLETLKGLKVPLDAVQEALHPRHEPAAEEEAQESQDRANVVNPMGWWNTLSQQFTQMTQQAMADVQAQVKAPSSSASTAKPAKAAGGAARAPARKSTASRKTAARSSKPRNTR